MFFFFWSITDDLKLEYAQTDLRNNAQRQLLIALTMLFRNSPPVICPSLWLSPTNPFFDLFSSLMVADYVLTRET